MAMVLVVGLLGGPACSTDDDDPRPREAADAACPGELGEGFEAWGDAGFSGVVVVRTGGEGECVAAYGVADREEGAANAAETVFSIGSVTKSVTSAAVFRLVDDGKLALDDRAGDLVPGLGGPAAEATVGQLLIHAGGLTGTHATADDQPLDRARAIAAIGRLEAAYPPGVRSLYSNAGYTLLAAIVEEVSGTTYRDYVMSTVLDLPGGRTVGGFWEGEPAAEGPRAVGYLPDGTAGNTGGFAGPYWATEGNGGLAMTMPDLAAWAEALFTGRLLSPESTAAVATRGTTTGTTNPATGEGSAEAPGWGVIDAETYGEPIVAAAGGGDGTGHNAIVAWLPESDRVVAVASNTADVTAEELVQAVAPALVAGDPLPRPPGAGEADPAELAAAAGTYELPAGGRYEVTAGDGGLEVAADGPAAVAALFPLGGGFTDADARAHEREVEALLAGETAEGRDEVAALEGDLGELAGVEVMGTIVEAGELRTYVALDVPDGPVLGWYALDEAGGIAAVDVSDRPPTLAFVPAGNGRYRPDDPTATGPDVTVTFEEAGEGDAGGMTVTGPGGTVTAARRPG